MSADTEDLLGVEDKPDPHAALKNLERPARLPRPAQSIEDKDMRLTGALKGVSVFWLANVFGMEPETVRRRLADVAPIRVDGKTRIYRVIDAAPYLVTPKIDIEKVLRDMKGSELPALLQKEIWDAKLKRQKWEREAGDLWHTMDVLAVLSEVFSIIKSTVMLWPDTVERAEGLTDPQRELLIRMGDALQDDIYNRLVEMSKERTTRASISDLTDDDEPEDLL